MLKQIHESGRLGFSRWPDGLDGRFCTSNRRQADRIAILDWYLKAGHPSAALECYSAI
jgi:hypothetical protein